MGVTATSVGKDLSYSFESGAFWGRFSLLSTRGLLTQSKAEFPASWFKLTNRTVTSILQQQEILNEINTIRSHGY